MRTSRAKSGRSGLKDRCFRSRFYRSRRAVDLNPHDLPILSHRIYSDPVRVSQVRVGTTGSTVIGVAADSTRMDRKCVRRFHERVDGTAGAASGRFLWGGQCILCFHDLLRWHYCTYSSFTVVRHRCSYTGVRPCMQPPGVPSGKDLERAWMGAVALRLAFMGFSRNLIS